MRKSKRGSHLTAPIYLPSLGQVTNIIAAKQDIWRKRYFLCCIIATLYLNNNILLCFYHKYLLCRSLSGFGAITRILFRHNLTGFRTAVLNIRLSASKWSEHNQEIDTPNVLDAIVRLWEQFKIHISTYLADTCFMASCTKEK